MGSFTAFLLCISLPILMGCRDNGSGYLISNLRKYDISGEDGTTTKMVQFSVVDVNGVATPFFTHSEKAFKFDMVKMDGVVTPENLWDSDNDKAQIYEQFVRFNDTTLLAFDAASYDLTEISLLSGNSTDDNPQSRKTYSRLNISDAVDIQLATTFSGKSTIIFAHGTVIAKHNLVTGHITKLVDVGDFYPAGEVQKLIMNNDGLLFVHLIQDEKSYFFYFNMKSGGLSNDPSVPSNISTFTQNFGLKFNRPFSDFTLIDDHTLLFADKKKYQLIVFQVQTGSVYRICRLINGDTGVQIVPFASSEECAGTFEPRRVAFHDNAVYVIIHNQLATFSLTDAKYEHDEESLTVPILLRVIISLGVTAALLLVVSLASISYIVRWKLARTTRTKRQGKQSTNVEAANNELEVIEMEVAATASPSQPSTSTEEDKNLSSTPYPRRANLTRADVTLHDPANPSTSPHGPSTSTRRESNNRHQNAPLVTYPSIKPAGFQNRPPAVPPKRLTNRHQIETKLTAYQTDIRQDRNTNNSIAPAHERAEIVTVEDVKRTDHDHLYEEIPLERNALP